MIWIRKGITRKSHREKKTLDCICGSGNRLSKAVQLQRRYQNKVDISSPNDIRDMFTLFRKGWWRWRYNKEHWGHYLRTVCDKKLKRRRRMKTGLWTATSLRTGSLGTLDSVFNRFRQIPGIIIIKSTPGVLIWEIMIHQWWHHTI